VKTLGFDPDAFVHELADAMIGDNYPVPDRFLVHAERVTRAFIEKTMFDGRPPAGTFDLFAVEGGTAAMCYIFDALKANRLLNAGDTIAIGAPIFTPYIEMPGLEDYQLKLIDVDQNSLADDGSHSWQYEEDQIKKLEDPPSRPSSSPTPPTRPRTRSARRPSIASSSS
jgi:aspartate 4-decarboxylase